MHLKWSVGRHLMSIHCLTLRVLGCDLYRICYGPLCAVRGFKIESNIVLIFVPHSWKNKNKMDWVSLSSYLTLRKQKSKSTVEWNPLIHRQVLKKICTVLSTILAPQSQEFLQSL